MAHRLSDDELRKALQDYSEDVGPITPTTRSIYEKRLLAFRKGNRSSPKRRSLNAFSSDDSEIESTASSRVRKKRTTSRNDSAERLSLNRSKDLNSSQDSDIFKKPSPLHIPGSSQGQRTVSDKSLLHQSQFAKTKNRKSAGKSSTFDVETSDSEAENSFTRSRSLRLRNKSTGFSFTPPSLLGISVNKNTDSTNYESPLQRKTGISWSPDTSSYRFCPIENKLKRDISDHGFRSNGYLTSSVSSNEFQEEKLQGSSTNYSHCVSWMLVFGAVAFFVFIGALYMSGVQKSSQAANKNYLKFCDGLPEDKCKYVISLSHEMHRILTVAAGEYECDTTGLVESRNLTVPEIRSKLKEEFNTNDIKSASFEDLFQSSLYLISKHPEWGIKYYSVLPNQILNPKSKIPESSALEATQAAKPFWCRVRLSLKWTTSRLIMLLGVVLLMFLCHIALNFWKKRREIQEKLFYEMVENVIEILQEPDSSYQPDSNIGPCKAVVNIRDTLISPKDRKEKLWLWDKVVSFIEENESRVSVEYHKINGEDFKVWRWHPSTSSENESGKQGKVWQGQAFNNLVKGKIANYSPTPCLKIRNMFDPEVEYGDDWQVNIQDAILEKCEGNDGIRHIAIDTTNNEGCVYLLCSSSEAAGKAFNALHGWWFDGKLVTVKYIRYERYLERFPNAEHCVEPLKPSNNMRLSLSTPFFSSALERS